MTCCELIGLFLAYGINNDAVSLQMYRLIMCCTAYVFVVNLSLCAHVTANVMMLFLFCWKLTARLTVMQWFDCCWMLQKPMQQHPSFHPSCSVIKTSFQPYPRITTNSSNNGLQTTIYFKQFYLIKQLNYLTLPHFKMQKKTLLLFCVWDALKTVL